MRLEQYFELTRFMYIQGYAEAARCTTAAGPSEKC